MRNQWLKNVQWSLFLLTIALTIVFTFLQFNRHTEDIQPYQYLLWIGFPVLYITGLLLTFKTLLYGGAIMMDSILIYNIVYWIQTQTWFQHFDLSILFFLGAAFIILHLYMFPTNRD